MSAHPPPASTPEPASPALGDWFLDALATACRRERSELSLTTSVWELALDSLSLVSVVVQAELLYDVVLDVDDLETMLRCARVGDLLELLEHRAKPARR